MSSRKILFGATMHTNCSRHPILTPNDLISLMIKYAHNTYDGRTQKISSEYTIVLFLEEKANSCQSDIECWRVPGACTYIVIHYRVISMRNAFDCGNAMLGKITFLENLPLLTTDD